MKRFFRFLVAALGQTGLVLFARARSEWAADCVQEAFLRLAVLSAIPNDPVAWLATVVRNLAISKFRQESRRRLRENLYANDRASWFHDDRPFETGMNANEVQTALMKREPTERELIVAHLWNGLAFRQIATVFEFPRLPHIETSFRRSYRSDLFWKQAKSKQT
ncbi:MAG TPA: sigma factor [Pirellula sp.]|nr:sigma factor [Pirellula sp.]